DALPIAGTTRVHGLPRPSPRSVVFVPEHRSDALLTRPARAAAPGPRRACSTATGAGPAEEEGAAGVTGAPTPGTTNGDAPRGGAAVGRQVPVRAVRGAGGSLAQVGVVTDLVHEDRVRRAGLAHRGTRDDD